MKGIPFTINVPDAAVSDLRLRLGLTRWPDEIGGGTWEYGTPLAVLKGVVEYWRDRFDWRKAERNLNGLPQFQIELEGRRVHYVHVMGVDADSVPLILTHGWPGSFVEMNRIIPMLTDPANNGLPGFRSFDVIAPSLPGFGFSQAPESPGTHSQVVARIWHRLMAELGYSSYFTQGGDIGAGVSSWLARSYPAAIRALHLNFIPGSYQPPAGSQRQAPHPCRIRVADATQSMARTRRRLQPPSRHEAPDARIFPCRFPRRPSRLDTREVLRLE